MNALMQNGKIIIAVILSLLLVLNNCMAACISGGSQIGLVLSGGGAKGAYEVGVWEVLKETHVADDICAISGTSIGAINAALFASVPKPDVIKSVWLDEIGGILSVSANALEMFGTPEDRAKEAQLRMRHIEEDVIAEAKKRNIPTNALPETILSEIIDRCYSVSAKKLLLKHGGRRLCAAVCGFIDDGRSDGFLATKGLQDVARNTLPTKWEDVAPRVYATALRKLPGNEFYKEVFALNNVDAETRIEMICASASVPVFFGTFSIKGKAYVDGGWEEKGGDNVPIAPILDNHPQIKTIIVVYLNDERHIKPDQRDRVRGTAEKSGVRLVEIIPSEDIGGGLGGWGGLFDASPETARRLIELGRKDARKVLAEAGMAK